MKRLVFLIVSLLSISIVHASLMTEDDGDILSKRAKVTKEIKELSVILEEIRRESDPSKKYLEDYYEDYISDYQKLKSSIGKDTDIDSEISSIRRKNNLFLSSSYM